MKKLSVLLVVLCLFIGFSSNDVFAKAIGVKGGYTMPKDDLSDCEDTWDFGLYFDMGTFMINNLDFRPSIDTFTLKTEDVDIYDVWGIHFDWYWHFLDKGSIAPFIGFGPSLNYYDYEDDDNVPDNPVLLCSSFSACRPDGAGDAVPASAFRRGTSSHSFADVFARRCAGSGR